MQKQRETEMFERSCMVPQDKPLIDIRTDGSVDLAVRWYKREFRKQVHDRKILGSESYGAIRSTYNYSTIIRRN